MALGKGYNGSNRKKRREQLFSILVVVISLIFLSTLAFYFVVPGKH